MTRRDIMAAAVTSAIAPTAACGQSTPQARADALVAYFTRSGNTRVIAAGISRNLGAPLVEILAARPYPEDYEATVEQAERERRADFRPALIPLHRQPARFSKIFLGFPIWGMTAPPTIRSFLSQHDLTGKTLIPFITHGGYGIGDSLDILDSLAPGAVRQEPFVLECDQERRTLKSVNDWLDSLAISKPSG